ncbi:MAG: hypothetical protein CMH30_07635 [Micavibrio sp.]|nr:hypothetical protein [Micavibrio sp.]|tara:strand:+ start:1658 stop:2539 length:882 start_codon:yes stop_codon:yes gene_type:complete
MNELDLSPLYGPIDSNGLPILGKSVFKELFTGEWSQENWPAHVLEPGAQNITKVYIEDGQLMASGLMTDPPIMPAMWDYDDLQVVMALIYGSEDGPIDPVFDLATTTDFAPDVMEKIWTPFWLEKTNFGRTMFCAYYWLRSFLLFPEKFRVCNKEDASDERDWEMGWQVIDYLKSMKEQYQFNINDKVIIKPAETKLAFHKDQQRIELEDFRMEIQILRLNEDNKYTLCPYSSEAFNIAFQRVFRIILPIFTRVDAIISLYTCVKYLREQGLSADQEYINLAKREFAEFDRKS